MTRGPKSEWTSPSILVAIMGLLAMAYSGYVTFQKDTAHDYQSLAERVAKLEAQVTMLEARL